MRVAGTGLRTRVFTSQSTPSPLKAAMTDSTALSDAPRIGGGCWFRDFRPPLESITTAHQVNGLSTSPLRSDQGRQGYAGTGSVAGSGRVLGVLLAYANRGSGRPLRIDMSGRAQGHLLGRRGVHWEQVGCDSAPVSALLVEMGTMLLVRAEWRYPRSRSPPRLRGHRCRAPTTNAWRS